MLVDVGSDRQFQQYLDHMEQRLYAVMMPVLSTGIALVPRRNSIQAQNYIEARGGPLLLKFYKRVYRDQFEALDRREDDFVIKAVRPVTNFMEEQLTFLAMQGGSKIRGMADSTVREIRDLMMQMVRDGKGQDKIAREILKIAPDISRRRAATIARTEAHNSSLAAIEASLKYKNIEVTTKTWRTVQDERVRESHAAVDGVTVPFTEPFEVGNAQMMRPGDASMGAGPEEIVNCRCAIIFSTPQSNFQPSIVADGSAKAKVEQDKWVAASPLKTIDDLVRVAPVMQQNLGTLGKLIEKELSGVKLVDPGVKTKNAKGITRTMQKISDRGSAAAVTDVARATFVIDSPGKADQIARRLGRRFQVLKEDWRRLDTGFVNRTFVIRDRSGLLGEVQIIEPKMKKAAETKGHLMYEEQRELPAISARWLELYNEMRALYGAVYDNYPPEWKALFGKGGK